MKLAVVTRIHTMYTHQSNDATPPPHSQISSTQPLPTIIQFIQSTLNYTNILIICLGAPTLEGVQYLQSFYTTLLQQYLTKPLFDQIHILPIFPWGHFTTALNTSLLYAQDLNADYVMFQVSYVLFLSY